jgi:hypothetical protein
VHLDPVGSVKYRWIRIRLALLGMRTKKFYDFSTNVQLRVGFVFGSPIFLMSFRIQIWIGIKIELRIRIRIGIKTMLIHKVRYGTENDKINISYGTCRLDFNIKAFSADPDPAK